MSCLDVQPRTKHKRSGKGQQCGCWRFGSGLGRGWKREGEKREGEKKGESKSGAEGVTADISLRVLRLILSSSFLLSMDHNADRRGRPTWRSKRKSVPSSISARRIGTSAEWAGCQPRNKLGTLFLFSFFSLLFSNPPIAPLSVLSRQNILEAPYLAPQTRLARDACMTAEHGERFLPPAAPPHRHNPASHQQWPPSPAAPLRRRPPIGLGASL